MMTTPYKIRTVPSYFSNISGIEYLAVLHDAPEDHSQAELALYFNDLYQVFLHKFSHFVHQDELSVEQETQMKAMLQELIKVKHTMHSHEPMH
jgi:hypothetical protein